MDKSFLIANSYPTRTQEIIVKYICTLHSSVNEQKKHKNYVAICYFIICNIFPVDHYVLSTKVCRALGLYEKELHLLYT
mgnify:FL=1